MKTTSSSDFDSRGNGSEGEESGGEKISRRTILRQAALGSILLALPWSSSAYSFLMPPAPKPPIIPFQPGKVGEGIVGPYGEARIFVVGDEILPIYVAAFDGSALMDMTVRNPFVRYGTGTTAITLTAGGIQFGTDKPIAWSGEMVPKLITSLARDRNKARSVLLLRSALHTAYPFAVSRSKTQTKNSKGKAAAAVSKGAQGLGASSMKCVTTTITDTVTRTITDSVAVIKTATQQYQECYDREVVKDPCRSLGFAAGACAAGIRAPTTFIDMVTGFIEVVRTITEEVTRQAVSCVKQFKLEWPNPWVVGTPVSNAAFPQPSLAFGTKEIEGALKLLKDLAGFLGPFGTCLLGGTWSLAQATTPLDLGNGPLTIPYGVKVCISTTCAGQLSADSIAGELVASWGAALGALAAFSPEFAAIVSSLGITATPAIVAAIAAIPPTIVAAAALILAFIILALIYGTAISGQLFFHRHYTSNFDDGVVCIEHASFALGLIKAATLGFVPAELIPPIVTG